MGQGRPADLSAMSFSEDFVQAAPRDEREEAQQSPANDSEDSARLMIPLDLLRKFRPAETPRKSNALRMKLSDGEMVALATHVWVQEDGEVYSNISGRMVCLAQQKVGVYKYVQISLDGDKRKFPVARLVMFAHHHERLVGRCAEAAAAGDTEHLHPDDFEAGHRDDDPDNNAASNIEPQTRDEQQAQSHARPERRSSAAARSRPVVVAAIRASASAEARAFPVGHEFRSIAEAGRQTGIPHGNISQSAIKGYFAGGVRFESGKRDQDPPGRVWYPSEESDKWCMTLGGLGFRVSNDGFIWIKYRKETRGTVDEGTIYRWIKIGGKKYPAHTVILRCFNGAPDENEEWVLQDVPKDANGKNLMCLHGGAPDDERRADGTERNHIADLRWGTAAENAADRELSRAAKRARVV